MTDHRLTCLGAAVRFAKKNNLLGIFVDAAALVSFGNVISVGFVAQGIFAGPSSVID